MTKEGMNLCIGKEVTFRVDYTAPNVGRGFGTVYLGDKNVAYSAVAAGWARVKEQGPKGEQNPYLAELQRLEEVAKPCAGDSAALAGKYVKKVSVGRPAPSSRSSCPTPGPPWRRYSASKQAAEGMALAVFNRALKLSGLGLQVMGVGFTGSLASSCTKHGDHSLPICIGCIVGGVLLLAGLGVLVWIDQDDGRHSFGHF